MREVRYRGTSVRGYYVGYVEEWRMSLFVDSRTGVIFHTIINRSDVTSVLVDDNEQKKNPGPKIENSLAPRKLPAISLLIPCLCGV